MSIDNGAIFGASDSDDDEEMGFLRLMIQIHYSTLVMADKVQEQ
jgi:hypothetical protein